MIRECGGCKACCTVFEITELNKPARTPCEHECDTGCAIYGNHPESCQHFMCVWVRGFGGELDRPDRLGIYVEERGGPPAGRQMIVKEVVRGAAETEAVRDYMLRLKRASGLPVYISNWDQDMLIGEVMDLEAENKKEMRKKRRKQLKTRGKK